MSSSSSAASPENVVVNEDPLFLLPPASSSSSTSIFLTPTSDLNSDVGPTTTKTPTSPATDEDLHLLLNLPDSPASPALHDVGPSPTATRTSPVHDVGPTADQVVAPTNFAAEGGSRPKSPATSNVGTTRGPTTANCSRRRQKRGLTKKTTITTNPAFSSSQQVSSNTSTTTSQNNKSKKKEKARTLPATMRKAALESDDPSPPLSRRQVERIFITPVPRPPLKQQNKAKVPPAGASGSCSSSGDALYNAIMSSGGEFNESIGQDDPVKLAVASGYITSKPPWWPVNRRPDE